MNGEVFMASLLMKNGVSFADEVLLDDTLSGHENLRAGGVVVGVFGERTKN